MVVAVVIYKLKGDNICDLLNNIKYTADTAEKWLHNIFTLGAPRQTPDLSFDTSIPTPRPWSSILPNVFSVWVLWRVPLKAKTLTQIFTEPCNLNFRVFIVVILCNRKACIWFVHSFGDQVSRWGVNNVIPTSTQGWAWFETNTSRNTPRIHVRFSREVKMYRMALQQRVRPTAPLKGLAMAFILFVMFLQTTRGLSVVVTRLPERSDQFALLDGHGQGNCGEGLSKFCEKAGATEVQDAACGSQSAEDCSCRRCSCPRDKPTFLPHVGLCLGLKNITKILHGANLTGKLLSISRQERFVFVCYCQGRGLLWERRLLISTIVGGLRIAARFQDIPFEYWEWGGNICFLIWRPKVFVLHLYYTRNILSTWTNYSKGV